MNSLSLSDIATIVESQASELERMSWMAIDTFENTQSGLEHIVQAADYSVSSAKQRRERLIMSVFGIVVFVGFVFLKLQPAAGDDGSDGAIILP